MTEQISQRELRNDSGRIMRGLDAGQTYVLTRRSQPVGELRPLRRRRLVDAQAVVEAFANAPAVDADWFFADIDDGIDQGINPRA